MRLATTAGFAVTALVVAVFPSAAQAATVALDRSCYSPGEAITETGSGFTPNGQVSESLSLIEPERLQPLGSLSAPPITADAQGAFSRQIRAPRLARAVDRTEIAISAFADETDPAGKTAFVQWTLSAWDVEIAAWANGTAKPRKRMLIDTYGWTSAASTLYAHYYRGRKLVKDTRIGKLTGECGDLRKRVRQFPFRTVKSGRWTVYFTGTRTHDKQDDPSISFQVRVRK